MGLHAVIQTCRHVPSPSIKELLEFTDLALCDIQCIESGKYKDAAGEPNELSLEGAKRLNMLRWAVRVVLIPDFNDSCEGEKKIVLFVKNKMGPV